MMARRKKNQRSQKSFKYLFVFVFLGFFSYNFIKTLLFIDVPDSEWLANNMPTVTSYMNEDPYFDENPLKRIDPVDIKSVSPRFLKAILTAEDDTFFEHNGFNWQQINKAFKLNMKKNSYARGASTITQQLARNLFLTRDKTLWRKFRETMITVWMENNLSKWRILELYINSVEYGAGIYGITNASAYYFNTSPKDLTAEQGAFLAGILPNPKVYGKRPFPDRALRRQRLILARLRRTKLPDYNQRIVKKETSLSDILQTLMAGIDLTTSSHSHKENSNDKNKNHKNQTQYEKSTNESKAKNKRTDAIEVLSSKADSVTDIPKPQPMALPSLEQNSENELQEDTLELTEENDSTILPEESVESTAPLNPDEVFLDE